MKGVFTLTILMGISHTAGAETFGTGGSFMFGGSAGESAPVTPAPAPPRPPVDIRPAAARAEIIAMPLPPPTPMPPTRPATVQIPATQGPPVTGDVPFQATVAIGSTRCPEPLAHPNARNTPVKVYVDQQGQSVRIDTPDRPQPIESRVSTGGGLKIPNGEVKKAPYCARTPRKERLIVSAVTPDMFKGSGCTPDEIRAKSTVFPMYHTRTFTDKNGQPIPMPQAVRIVGGIFFHEVPPSYREMLGHNVSGECVRLAPSVAKFLQAQIKKYGAIEVNITDPPQVARQMPQYCDDQMAANARQRQQGPGTSVAAAPQATGSEGVYGGEQSFFSILGRFFNPNPQPQVQQAPGPSRPVARTPVYRTPADRSDRG